MGPVTVTRRSLLRSAGGAVIAAAGAGGLTAGGLTAGTSRADEPDGPVIEVRPGQSIQAAIDSLPPSGGTVRVGAGHHNVTGPIYVRSNLVFEGAGRGQTVIEVPPTHVENFVGRYPQYVGEGMIDLVEGGVEDLVLRGFTLDGQIPLDVRNRDGSDGLGGETLRRPWGILLEDRAFPGAETFADNNARIEIADVEVMRTETGVHVKGCTGLWIHDCDLHHNGGVLLYYHNMYLRRDRQVLIERNRLADCHSANGLNLTLQADLTVRRNQFANNHFRGLRVAATERALIDGNLSQGSRTDWGLLLVSEGTGVRDFSVTGNIVLDNVRGLSVASGSDGVVSGNTVFGNQNGDDIVWNPGSNVEVEVPVPTWQYLGDLVTQLSYFDLISSHGTASALERHARHGNGQAFATLVDSREGRTVDRRAAALLRHVLADITGRQP